MIKKNVSIFTSNKEIEKIKIYSDLESELLDLFDKMKEYGYESREGQLYYSDSVLNAIKDNSILLIEAGVGTGKTKGYLIPILLAKKNDKNFKSAIISTSSKALQEQVASEIETTAKLLNMEVPKTVVIKGKNNYACINRAYIKNTRGINQENNDIIIKGVEQGLIERKDYPDMKEKDWLTVNASNCMFESCNNALNCPYYKLRKEAMDADIIVCNHDLTIEHLKREDKRNNLFKVPSALVFDEAHTLEDKFRNAFKGELDNKTIQNTITKLCSKDILRKTIPPEFFINLNSLYWETCNNSKQKLNETLQTNQDYTDCNRVVIEWSETKEKKIKYILKYLNDLCKEFTSHIIKNRIDLSEKENEELLRLKQDLDNYIFIFEQLTKEDSDYIFWLEFTNNNYITLYYAPKNIDNIIKELLSKNKYTKVFTSATLTEGNDYSYFKANIGINKITNQKIIDEDPIESPYNYDESELVYVPQKLGNPNDKNRDRFIEYVTDEINKLTALTEGRTLILFTSKNELERVKNYLLELKKIKYDLLCQDENTRLEFLKEEFRENEHSILLSTGAWEGLDVKGSSLSSVIIPRLPFPLEDPIIKEKASLYINPMAEVYLKEMGIKLRQGIGRAIRSSEDSALVTLLDRRVETYYDYIEPLLQTSNITREKRVVNKFVKEKILKR